MKPTAANALTLSRALWRLRRREPTILGFNVTNRCNERCPMCAVWRAPAAELVLPEMERVLRSLRRFGILVVEVTGGEPFLRQDVFAILELLDRLGFLYTLNTNGTALPPDAGRRLDRLGGLLQLAVSLDSLDPGRYARLRGGGELARVLAALDALVADRPGFATKINFTMSRVNYDETLGMLDFARRRGLFLSVFPVNLGRGFAHRGHDAELVPDERERAAMAALFRELGRRRRRGAPLWDFSRFYDFAAAYVAGRPVGPCDAGRLYLDLHADGTLAACVDLPGFADLLREDVAVAWRRIAPERAKARACAATSPCCYTCTSNLSITADHLVAFALETGVVRAAALWRRLAARGARAAGA